MWIDILLCNGIFIFRFTCIIMIINPSFMSNLDNGTFMMKDLISFFSIFMFFTALLGGVYYYISYRFMDKKLNLE